MRVYITDLEAYNNGHLVGQWYKLPMDSDLLAEGIENVLQEGRNICGDTHFHEEYFITDYECEYMEDINEYSNLTELNEIAEKMETLNSSDIKKFKALIQEGYDFEYSFNNYEDMEMYEEINMNELAEQFVEDGLFGDIPKALINYIDYDAIARDLSMDYTEIDNDIVRFN